MTIDQAETVLALLGRIRVAKREKSNVQQELEKYESARSNSPSGLGEYKYPPGVHILCYRVRLTHLNEEIDRVTKELNDL